MNKILYDGKRGVRRLHLASHLIGIVISDLYNNNMADYNKTPTCSSSSNVFSWKISFEEWTQTAEGHSLPLPFEIMAPTDGKIIKMQLDVYPKGQPILNARRGEGNELYYILIPLTTNIEARLPKLKCKNKNAAL